MQEAVGRWHSEEELEQQAQALRQELGLDALLVTRSEQGMTLFSQDGRQHTDAYAHEVFDVSGAGDTVLAALAVTRAAGLDWFEAVMWANRAGGVVVGKLGTSVVTADRKSVVSGNSGSESVDTGGSRILHKTTILKPTSIHKLLQ